MKSIKIVGPFFSNYSLARVNRGLGLALAEFQNEYSVKLYCDKDKIDYYPTDADLAKRPDIAAIFSKDDFEADIAIYDNFPKNLTNPLGLKNLNAKVKLMYIAWEETIYPAIWVNEINENLHGVMAMSKFTKDVLVSSGVKVPIQVIDIALDDQVRVKATGTYPLNTTKKFKFLHVSTAKQRKGVDLLIKAYCESFTKDDDVVLVIKSSPGPDNLVEQLIAKFKTENSPGILHINNPDLTEEDLRNLFAECNCGVFPSRAEGFGLPILECMYHGVPVITTNYSGQLDFCSTENSYLLDYKMEFAKDSELVNVGAKWAEPDVNQLKEYMRLIYEIRNSKSEMRNEYEELQQKIKKAKEVADTFTWENSAKGVLAFVKEIAEIAPLKEEGCAVLSFINNESGIADYTEDLYRSIEHSFKNFYYLANKDISDRVVPDGDNVVRTWTSGEIDFEETLNFLKEQNLKYLHIQYHSGSYFPVASLDTLIQKAKAQGHNVLVTLHAVRSSTFDFIKESKDLKDADLVLIHNKNDLEHAKQTLQNAALMTLPAVEFKQRSKVSLKKKLELDQFSPIVIAHGLLNTNKGIDKIIDAIAILKKGYPNILFLGLNAVSSNNIYSSSLFEQIKSQVKTNNLENNVRMITDFLSDDFIQIFMQSGDINVFAYVDTAGESASASIRKALASLNPTIVTDINMFQEFNSEVYKIKDNEPQTIADGIKKIVEDKKLQEQIVSAAKKFITENSYESKALWTLKTYLSIKQ